MTSAPSSSGSSKRASRGVVGRFIRAVLLVVLLILLLPYLLAPLYRLINPVSTLMLGRWIAGARVDHSYVPLGRIAPILPLTVIASEDARFCNHRGIDWQELQTAMEDAEDLGDMRGVSTITQQIVKNLFLWPGRSLVRKALEFPLALWFDLVVPKRRQMEIYLNIAEWGPNGEFGVEAGARRAFNRSAQTLTAPEAALLAAVLPNPHRRSARIPGPAVRRIAARIQARAAQARSIDECLRQGGGRNR